MENKIKNESCECNYYVCMMKLQNILYYKLCVNVSVQNE